MSAGWALLSAALVTAALWAAARTPSPFWRWLWAAIFTISAWFFTGYRMAMDAHMTFDVFKTMFGYRSFAGLAAAQYGPSIIWSLLVSLPLFVGIGLRPHPARRRPALAALAALPLLMIAALTGFLAMTGDKKDYPLPGLFASPAFASLMTYDALTAGPDKGRAAVALAHDGSRPARDIVYVIDESMAPLYLDINDKGGVYSGLAQPRPGWSIANFGVASAITHCTNATNQTLRHGGTRGAYRHLNAHGPSIFAYAKAAGFETVYIDTQTTGGQLHNAMDEAERAQIDRFIQFDDVPAINRDHAAADRLRALLEDNRFQFILVNKQGAHFPVHASYPPDQRPYAPVAPREQYFGSEEWNPLLTFSAARKDWRLYRNAYRNTIVWNVGGFFDRLLAAPPQSPATIIYTADHGQDLHERGNIGTNTHCTPWPLAEEGAVPLVLLESGGLDGPWQELAKAHHNARSHYQLFPTLLQLMGYDAAAVAVQYGEGLDSKARDPMTFNILFRAREGHAPQWQKMDPQKLTRPPLSDYAQSRAD